MYSLQDLRCPGCLVCDLLALQVLHLDLKTRNVLLSSSGSEGRGVICKVQRPSGALAHACGTYAHKHARTHTCNLPELGSLCSHQLPAARPGKQRSEESSVLLKQQGKKRAA